MLNTENRLVLEKNLAIIKQLFERVDKINKAFKTGKEMLQTVHQYWLPEYQHQHHNFKDINGKRISYDFIKYRKPRNKFLKKEIKDKYNPPYEELRSVINKLKFYKSKYEHYLNKGLPSFTINKDTLDLKFNGLRNFEYPHPFFLKELIEIKKKVSDEITKQNFEDRFHESLAMYHCMFDESLEKEIYDFRKFKHTIFENIIRDLVITVSRFRKKYISTYKHIMLTYDIHLNKTQPSEMKSDLINFLLLLKYDPELPSQAVSQPPYIELPNMVSFEEYVQEYYRIPQY